jgi:hypothetical protein
MGDSFNAVLLGPLYPFGRSIPLELTHV